MVAVGRRVIGCTVHALDDVDSTQAELARLAGEGAPEGTVVTARHQQAGRGRRGRFWWDAPGEGLILSVLLRPPVPAAQAPQLSLVGAVAVSDALEAASGVEARIRWPNDVLLGGLKLCGILPEAVSGPGGRLAHVILGIGINVNQDRFPADLSGRATSLRLATGTRHDPGRLLEAVLDALDRRYAEWLAGGFAVMRDAWRQRSATLGQPVALPEGGGGVAVDVDVDGALLVRAGDGGLRRVVSGEPEGGERHAAGH